ncbi:hypothetical protein BGX29_001709 [Mortierella sp. GBA35]|nr:hypothetical protein BGX29_001709 [Mortierella sp. GBA35]
MTVSNIIAEDLTTTFTGWASYGSLPLKKFSYHPRPLGPEDIEIEITHCGVCASDAHTTTGGWGELTLGPCIVGHEIAGTIVAAGPKSVRSVGESVAVGCIVDTCGGDCKDCKEGSDQLCKQAVYTYNNVYKDGSEAKTYGGYADRLRVKSKWAYKIPKEITTAEVAPLLCAGITTYAPLKKYGAGPGKKVGVLGVGGLGHLGIQWAAAMNADEVVAISTSDSKREEAKKLGATKFVNSKNEEERKSINRSLDIFLLTSNDRNTDWAELIEYVANKGILVLLALPEVPTIAVPPVSVVFREISIVGSMIAGLSLTQEMLEFAAKHGVRPWIEKMPMSDANAAMMHLLEGSPRYRIVLETEAATRL